MPNDNTVVVPFPGANREVGADLVLVKPGAYTAIYVSHAGTYVFRQAKLRVMFQLMEHPDLVLPRWYRVTSYKGRVSAVVHSDLVREVSVVLGTRIRHDRIPVGSLAEIPVSIDVRTVVTDKQQDPLETVNQYSVVSKVRGRA